MILKLGMKHQGEDLYKVCINHDLGMTLTYFMAVYDHNIQTSSLRQLGQSKPNFVWTIVRKGEWKLI